MTENNCAMTKHDPKFEFDNTYARDLGRVLCALEG